MLNFLLKHFRPDEFADSFTDADYAALYNKGIRGLIFDIDNTLEGYEAEIPSQKTAGFLQSLIKTGFKICFVSNNNIKRITKFNSTLNFPAIHKAGKPKKSAVYRAAKLMDVPINNIAIIGDQIFTDIFCGKRLGLHTILVEPVTSNDPWIVKIKRVPERIIVKYYKKQKSCAKGEEK